MHKVCINDDPWLTLTNSTAMSNLVNLLFVPFVVSMLLKFERCWGNDNTWPSKAKKDAYFSFCWHF